MQFMEPFQQMLDLTAGNFQPVGNKFDRRLSDMRGMYYDTAAEDALLKAGEDPAIYTVEAVHLPEEEGQVLYGTTVIHPGKVGDEYYMTKGHYHEKRDRGEIYLGLSGEGYLLLQTDTGEVRSEFMRAGTIAYVPPYWAHRTINVGSVPFVFFAAWPGDAGHDYGTIETEGFAQLCVERDGKPVFIDNPRYQR